MKSAQFGRGTPLISIVTPSYNQGRFIGETIASVLSQDYPHVELWVIDGGSTDETIEVLRSFESDPRFHWVSERDKGQSDAINKGLARCTGEIFSWLNSDDLLLPGALAAVAQAWSELRAPAVIYGLARHIDEHGGDLGPCPLQSPRITLRDMLRMRALPMQQATFAPTAVVRELGGVDQSLHFAMDLDLWVRLIARLPFHHVARELALYRLHGDSKTVTLSARFTEDYARLLRQAAHQGQISPALAAAYADIYAARIALVPEIRDLPAATQALFTAARRAPVTTPECALVLGKGLTRLAFGERFWATIRGLRARLG